ncbi:MAG: hypothetical protein C4320_07465 [Armatimonadota bacterium]
METRVRSTGTVEQNGANFVYRKIELGVDITLQEGATDEEVALAAEMAHKADAYCIVTNAIRDKIQVTIEPNVTRAGTTHPSPEPNTESSDTPEVESNGYAGGEVPTESAEVVERPATATPTQSSEQAGDPDEMKIGAVPG